MTDEELGREIEGVRARTWFIRPGATNAAMGARARELLAPEPLPEDVEALAAWLWRARYPSASNGPWSDTLRPHNFRILATALLRRIGKLPLEVPAETKKPEPAEVARKVVQIMSSKSGEEALEFARADDGTLWLAQWKADKVVSWIQLPALPSRTGGTP